MELCDYCEELIFKESFCCIKGGMKKILKSHINDFKYGGRGSNIHFLKLIPFIFFIAFFVNVGCCIFFDKRRKLSLSTFTTRKDNNCIFSSYDQKENYASISFFMLSILISFLLFFIFLLPCIIIYMIFIIILFIEIYKK